MLINQSAHIVYMPTHFPSWLNLNTALEAAAGTAVEVETTLPVRIGESQVVEILAVQWDIIIGSPAGNTADLVADVIASLSKRSSGSTPAVVELSDPDCIDRVTIRQAIIALEATETGAGGLSQKLTIYHNFAHGDKGFLVAANSLFLAIDGLSTLAVSQAFCRVLFRLVKVSAQDLLGLVSQ